MPIGKPLDIRKSLEGVDSIYINPNGIETSGSAIDVCDGVIRTLAINLSGAASSGKSIEDLETEMSHVIGDIDSVYALTLLAHRVVVNAGPLQFVIDETKRRAHARLSELSQQG